MRIVVHDASILIDLHHAGALDAWLASGIEAWTTDLVFLEVEQSLELQRKSGALKVKQYTGKELGALIEARAALPPSLSLEDSSALFLAQTLQAALLTGDGDLRKAALATGLEVHGTLWILDELVAAGVTTPRQAAAMLERILQTRARLPAAECELRLARWRADSAK
jgi:predicted nucleic acid-binding protein